MKKTLHDKLVAAALRAQELALAPYSNFRVGAAIATKAGAIYTAGNIESSSYGLTICAERVALFKALSEGERDFTLVAVATDTADFCTPCGACRQVLWDYAPHIDVILINSKQATARHALADLLPHAFDNRMFKK